MIIKVIHVSPKADFSGVDRTHIANVTVDDRLSELKACELAYFRTQNIEGSWSIGPWFEDNSPNPDFSEKIEVMVPVERFNGRIYGHRSSMVNDEFVLEDGTTYRCMMVGFMKVEK